MENWTVFFCGYWFRYNYIFLTAGRIRSHWTWKRAERDKAPFVSVRSLLPEWFYSGINTIPSWMIDYILSQFCCIFCLWCMWIWFVTVRKKIPRRFRSALSWKILQWSMRFLFCWGKSQNSWQITRGLHQAHETEQPRFCHKNSVVSDRIEKDTIHCWSASQIQKLACGKRVRYPCWRYEQRLAACCSFQVPFTRWSNHPEKWERDVSPYNVWVVLFSLAYCRDSI